MKIFVCKHTLGFLLLFGTIVGFSQRIYIPEAKPTEWSLEGKLLKGYQTHFDYDGEEVRRGWWEYARKFSNPVNMKTYYKVIVPSEGTDGNVDLEIFTQTTSDQKGTLFFLGLEKTHYQKQAQSLILDFKKTFYIREILDKIEQKQKQANERGRQYRQVVNEDQKSDLLQQINQLEGEIELLKEQIKEIEKK